MAKFHKIQCDRFDLVENKLESTIVEVNANKDDILGLKQEVKKLKAMLSESASESQSEIKAMHERVSTLNDANSAVKNQLGLLKTPEYIAPPLDTSWERPPRAEVLSIGAAEHISKDALLQTIETWLEPLSLTKEDWRLEGPAFARNWDLFFNGNFASIESASLRANKANLLLRKPDGTWNKLHAKDPEGKDVELFISKDAMPKHKREITLTKRLFKAVERSFGTNKGMVFNKKFRTIRYKGIDFAKVCCKSFEVFEVQWIHEQVANIGLNREAILGDFHSHTGLAPNHAWSI